VFPPQGEGNTGNTLPVYLDTGISKGKEISTGVRRFTRREGGGVGSVRRWSRLFPCLSTLWPIALTNRWREGQGREGLPVVYRWAVTYWLGSRHIRGKGAPVR